MLLSSVLGLLEVEPMGSIRCCCLRVAGRLCLCGGGVGVGRSHFGVYACCG